MRKTTIEEKKQTRKIWREKNAVKIKEQKHNSYLRHSQKVKLKSNRYRKQNPNYNKDYLREYRETNPDKVKDSRKRYWDKIKDDIKSFKKREARWKAECIPIKGMCQICNKNKAVERHHDDYSKPYFVKLLCKECHIDIHRRYR